jgi:hypothetical protein
MGAEPKSSESGENAPDSRGDEASAWGDRPSWGFAAFVVGVMATLLFLTWLSNWREANAILRARQEAQAAAGSPGATGSASGAGAAGTAAAAGEKTGSGAGIKRSARNSSENRPVDTGRSKSDSAKR